MFDRAPFKSRQNDHNKAEQELQNKTGKSIQELQIEQFKSSQQFFVSIKRSPNEMSVGETQRIDRKSSELTQRVEQFLYNKVDEKSFNKRVDNLLSNNNEKTARDGTKPVANKTGADMDAVSPKSKTDSQRQASVSAGYRAEAEKYQQQQSAQSNPGATRKTENAVRDASSSKPAQTPVVPDKGQQAREWGSGWLASKLSVAKEWASEAIGLSKSGDAAKVPPSSSQHSTQSGSSFDKALQREIKKSDSSRSLQSFSDLSSHSSTSTLTSSTHSISSFSTGSSRSNLNSQTDRTQRQTGLSPDGKQATGSEVGNPKRPANSEVEKVSRQNSPESANARRDDQTGPRLEVSTKIAIAYKEKTADSARNPAQNPAKADITINGRDGLYPKAPVRSESGASLARNNSETSLKTMTSGGEESADIAVGSAGEKLSRQDPPGSTKFTVRFSYSTQLNGTQELKSATVSVGSRVPVDPPSSRDQNKRDTPGEVSGRGNAGLKDTVSRPILDERQKFKSERLSI